MIKKWPVYIEPLQRETTLHIHLPDDYFLTEDRYPVMYMFDGHNLFLDEDATFRKSWGLEKFLSDYEKSFIVIGIECDHTGENRLQEYMPYRLEETFFGPARGDGALLMRWLVTTLKPQVDAQLRTYPHREATGIAGSSMGGLMAMYGLLHYNHIFSKAACLSPSFFIASDQIAQEFNSFLNQDNRLYLSIGGDELRGRRNRLNFINLLQTYARHIESRGGRALVNVVEGGKHSEHSWEKENPFWVDFLWH